MGIKSYKEITSLQTFVQEQLKLYILESNLKYGSLLPTEKKLSEKLGVSRTAIREALKVLETLGIIETKHGVGSFVRDFNYEAILKNLPYNLKLDIGKFSEVFEVRFCLECWFIAKDIEKYTVMDISELKEVLNKMEEKIIENVEEKELVDIHSNFHTLLYRNSKNELLIDLIRIFSTIQKNLVVLHRYTTKNRLNFIKLHRTIIEAIEAKDPFMAQKKLRLHFAETIKWIQDNTKEMKKVDIGNGFWFKKIKHNSNDLVS